MNHYHYRRTVAFYDTDAMGVVHHSNYIRYYEDARVAWLRDRGLMKFHSPFGPFTFAVVNLDCNYAKSARFGDELIVRVEARLEGARIFFRYALFSERLGSWISDGNTTLVAVDSVSLKPARLPVEMREAFAREKWSDVWPPMGF